MLPNMLEKLQLKDEKNLLIQGLPSSIEKQFTKLSFAKNVTPLLKARKIDFALIFALNAKQLNGILTDVIPALRPQGKLWIAFPKKGSKIVTDLDKKSSWEQLAKSEFKTVNNVTLDHVWNATRYCTQPIATKVDDEADTTDHKHIIEKPIKNNDETSLVIPPELAQLFTENTAVAKIFGKLPPSHKREYIEWIAGAKKEVTKQKRVKDTFDKLMAGKRNPNER